MIRSLRAFFLSRLLREKLLLLVFIAMGTLIWLSSFGKRANLVWMEQRTTSATLQTQRSFLEQKAQIYADVDRAAKQLEANKTYTRNSLVAEVSRLAVEAGFRTNTSNDPVETKSNGQFAVHSFTYKINNVPQANWQALQKFYVSLRDRSPYIAFDQFALASPNTAILNLQLRISAFEPVQR